MWISILNQWKGGYSTVPLLAFDIHYVKGGMVFGLGFMGFSLTMGYQKGIKKT